MNLIQRFVFLFLSLSQLLPLSAPCLLPRNSCTAAEQESARLKSALDESSENAMSSSLALLASIRAKEEADAAIAALEQELTAIDAAHAKQISALEAAHAKQLASTGAAHANDSGAATADLQQRLAAAEMAHRIEVDSIRAEHAAELAEHVDAAREMIETEREQLRQLSQK